MINSMGNKIYLSFLGIFLIVGLLSFDWKTETSTKVKDRANTAPVVLLKSNSTKALYDELAIQTKGHDFRVFQKALRGYLHLEATDSSTLRKPLVTVIDFSKPSSEKRFWVINLETKEILFSTWVAHGQGSGQSLATSFSNELNSYKSSLGFYKTGEVYYGKHGRSLKLDGLDKGVNDQARRRSVVVHGADYVSQEFIDKTGRLGRSQGCPALPINLSQQVIDTIKGETLLFIYGQDDTYFSDLLKV